MRKTRPSYLICVCDDLSLSNFVLRTFFLFHFPIVIHFFSHICFLYALHNLWAFWHSPIFILILRNKNISLLFRNPNWRVGKLLHFIISVILFSLDIIDIFIEKITIKCVLDYRNLDLDLRLKWGGYKRVFLIQNLVSLSGFSRENKWTRQDASSIFNLFLPFNFSDYCNNYENFISHILAFLRRTSSCVMCCQMKTYCTSTAQSRTIFSN